MTEHSASCHYQVGPGLKQRLINNKILLLGSEGSNHFLNVLIEQLTHACRRKIDSLQRFQQWGLCVERLTGVGDEDRGDTKCFSVEEHRRRRVPGCIAPRFECTADTATRE